MSLLIYHRRQSPSKMLTYHIRPRAGQGYERELPPARRALHFEDFIKDILIQCHSSKHFKINTSQRMIIVSHLEDTTLNFTAKLDSTQESSLNSEGESS